MDSERQRFDTLVMHTPHGTRRYRLPWTFSTFDYRELCELLWRPECDARFETAKVNGARRHGDGEIAVETDRGDDLALRWSSTRSAGGACSPAATATSRPTRRSRAASRSTPTARARTWRSGSTAATCPPATAGRSRPRDELRIGVGSFDPRFHVKDTTVLLAEDLGRTPVRYQGNWIPHKLRRATEGGVFFAGDSAGHCLPLTAEGIRTALYFGIALGRELRGVVEGRQEPRAGAADYAAFNDEHEWKFRWMLRVQRLVPQDARRGCSRRDPRCCGNQALRRLVLRPLPADRIAGVRAPRAARAGGAGAGRRGMSEEKILFGQEHVERYQATDGEEGHDWVEGAPTLLLTTRGRKSGEERTTPLIYGRSGEDYLVVGSKGGSPEPPAWYLNLVEDPEVGVQVKGDRFTARARDATPEEKPAMWETMTSHWPYYDDYQRITSREIPVVVLERMAG